MPLHGKIVVIKRSGGDGTEFPLTATCVFGRKADCDIRIQIPQVSKEHCRIDLNENKEVILTNLSSVSPTYINGQALQQSERLKHGDVITIIDRSFRFEYPPPPTPKKRSSVGGKAEVAAVDPHLKDGTNLDNIQRSAETAQELESKEGVSLLEGKTASPFSDLYQMIKQSLDVKTPRKSSASVLQTPSSKFCTPKPESARKKNDTPKKVQAPVPPVEKAQDGDASLQVTPKSAKKRGSVPISTDASHVQEAKPTPSPRRNPTPQKFTLNEVIEQITTPKSPKRRSKETTSPLSAKKCAASPAKAETPTKATPKSSEKGTEKSRKRKSEELAADLPTQEMKRKRVSFGGQLAPELFDKRLPPDSPLRKGATPRRSLSLYKPIKQSLLRRASVIGLLKECESPKGKNPAKMRTPSPKKSPKGASPKTPTSAKKSPKTQSPGKKSTTPKKTSPESPKAQSPVRKAQSPKATTPKSKSPSPGKKAATPKKTLPKSPKAQSPVQKTTTQKSKSPSPGKKAATPKKTSPKTPKDNARRKSTSTTDGTPKRKSTGCMVTPGKSPDLSPKVQGRFSVSRINTPSPVAVDAIMEQVPAATVTPKIPLKRKSMKSSTKQTPLKSATKVMRRKSGIMRSTKKVMSSWADIVRFGKAKVQVSASTRAQVIKKTVKKKAGPKPQTPKRRLMDHVGTGHAASPATIVVGRAHRLRVAHSAGAPPKMVMNTAVLRKNMKMDEDLTGLSEMFKTPKNEKRRSAKIVSKTPQTDMSKSLIEPSVLNTPEETGEMVVSPMSVASTVKGQRYNSEAVQRLLDGEESFASEVPALDMQCETAEMKVGTPKTPKQKPPMPEGLTGTKILTTPKQKAEAIEDPKTPKQKSDQQECLSAVIMKTPKEKATPIEDLRGKLLKTPKQKIQQQEECLTGVKRVMKTPKEKPQPVEDLWGRLLKTPKQHIEQQECLSAVKTLMKTPDQKVEQPESLPGVTRCMRSPKQQTEQQQCLTGVKRLTKTPKEKYEPIDDIRGNLLLTPKQKIEQQECLTGVKRLMRTPKVKVPPVEKNLGIKRLMQSPRLRGNTQVEDFEGLEELMKEPAEEQTSVVTEEIVIHEQPEANPELVDGLSEVEKVMAAEEILVLPESTSITLAEETKIIASVVESVQEESAPEAKPVRGRRAMTAEPTAENQQGLSEVTEAPVRARRGRKVQTSAPGQTAKTPEEPLKEESAPEPTVKPRRGRIAKKPKELIEEGQIIATESTAEPQTESEQILPTAVHEVEPSTAPEVPVVKTRRGRKNKADEPCDVVTTAQTAEETKEVEIVEDSTARDKKPAQTRRAKATESEVPAAAAENKNDSEEAVAPVRSRRGKKTEAPAASAVRQKRGRAGKVQEKDKVVPEETQQTAETISEHADDQTCAPGSTEEMVQENPSEPTKEIAPEKPKRGRKVKGQVEPAQPEPEIIAVEREPLVVEAKHVEDVQPEQSVPTKKLQRGRKAKTHVEPPQVETGSTAEEGSSSVCETVEDVQLEQLKPAQKARRGGRTKPAVEPSVQPEETTEKSEPVEDTQPEQAAPAEKPKRGRRARTAEDSHTAEVSQPPVQGKRSRTAKSDLEQHAAGELKSAEPAKKMRRTKKADPCEELHTEVVEETPDVEPLKATALVGAAPKSRRGAHKIKEAVTEEVSASSSTDKPKNGRKGKETNDEIKAVEVKEVEQAPEDDSAKVKPTRRRGKTAVQHGTSDTVPAKRARRGTVVATEESTEQDTKVMAEPVPVEPIKRGRRAAKIPALTEEVETKDQDNSTKESSNGIEDTQTSKRSVKWKADFEVFEVTPLKSLRGRKTKSAGQKEAESGNEPQKATDSEGKDLTEKLQPAKKSRRGAKAADVAEESTATVLENKDAETQPKTRRGRTAKK